MNQPTVPRFFTAWAVGVVTYLVGAVFTVLDGMLSFVLQPIMAAIFSAVAVTVCSLAGLVLRVPPLYRLWTGTNWPPRVVAGIGVALLIFSALPGQMRSHTRVFDDVEDGHREFPAQREFRETVVVHEESWKTLGDACGPGYFALLFAAANWPIRKRSLAQARG